MFGKKKTAEEMSNHENGIIFTQYTYINTNTYIYVVDTYRENKKETARRLLHWTTFKEKVNEGRETKKNAKQS